MGWSIVEVAGGVADLHAREPSWTTPAVAVYEVSAPAVVLGSTQPADDLDEAAVASLGAEVIRRRSGGGLVYLAPGAQLWFDVVMPRDHPAWDPDVVRAAVGVGHAVGRALRRGGLDGIDVHHGPPMARAAGRQICFAGVGAGEVVWHGRKLVGLAQRRTRAGARFQCSLHHRFDPAVHLALIPVDRRVADLGARLGAVAARAEVGGFLDALAEELPPG